MKPREMLHAAYGSTTALISTEPSIKSHEALSPEDVELVLNFGTDLLDGEEPTGQELDGEHGLNALLAVSGNRYHFGNGSGENTVFLDLRELTRPSDTKRIAHMAGREVAAVIFGDGGEDGDLEKFYIIKGATTLVAYSTSFPKADP